MGLGALAGLLLVAWRAPKKETIRYVDAAVFALFIALLGSRALFVITNWSYYGSRLGEVIQVWQGGLSSIGALLGGILAIFILVAWWKLPIGLLADTLFPLVGALTITSWLGCWVNTCSYGNPSNAWWALPARDVWGVMAGRIPVQLAGSVLTLALTWLIDRLGKRMETPGLAASLGMLGISAIVFALSYLRADPMPIWHGLRLEAWGAIGLMVFSGLIVVVLLVRWKLNKPPEPNRRVT
jgi:phosphatidylglycerol:prolipoprotein diacylglycerol transferase